MNYEDLTDDCRAFLDALARKVWQARREGALIGCLYTQCMVGLFRDLNARSNRLANALLDAGC